jgi:exosortase A
VAYSLILLAFAWTLGWLSTTTAEIGEIWWRSDTYAHGLIVLPVFGWLVWRGRDRLAVAQARPAAWMAVPALLAGLAWLLGQMVSVAAASHFFLVSLVVITLVGTLGWPLSRVLLFPLMFLFFGVPIGDFMLPTLMKYTAEFTVWALRLSGVAVYQEGLHFVVPNGRWSVVEACSGIRYLIASLTVGALYAYLNYTSLKRRLLFMLVAVAVPVLANWIRAYMIVMLGYLSDNRIAAGVDHLIYGWVFFGIVISLVFWIGGRWHEAPAWRCRPRAHRAAPPG